MTAQAVEAVEAEIRREKAEALGRAGERLERTLRHLESLRQELLGLPLDYPGSLPRGPKQTRPEIEDKLTVYHRLHEQARTFRHYLIIQREALGLGKHDDVDRQYRVPGLLTLSMLIRREDVE